MSEREPDIAAKVADMWLEFQMNPLTQMVPGDPDCDACILARQYIRATGHIDGMKVSMAEKTANLRDEITILRKALDKSIWFQSHYASLLNQYDGGQRKTFENGDAWIERLHELEPVQQKPYE